jgi:predicted DNA-binding transcriptional regulator AlpA
MANAVKILDDRGLRSKGIPFSRQHRHRLITAGKFPKPVKIGDATNGWIEAEIDKYIQDKIEERDAKVAQWVAGNGCRFEPTALSNDIVTEDNAALQFVAQYGQDLRYCHDTGAWFHFNGVMWLKDHTGRAFQFAREMVRQLGQDQDDRKRFITSKTSFAAGVEKYAKGDLAIAVTMAFWDRDLMLLGTPGGTVDLRTGQLRTGNRDDGITKTTGVAGRGAISSRGK